MKKRNFVLLILCFMLLCSMAVSAKLIYNAPDVHEPKEYLDVPEDHWAKEYIDYISSRTPYILDESEWFQPDYIPGREECMSAVVKLFRLETSTTFEKVFIDVYPDTWYAGYVQTMYDHGVVHGTGNGEFGTGRIITREEMVSVVMRTYALFDDGQEDQETVDFSMPTDIEDVSDWAQEYIKSAYEKGIVVGAPENEFRPGDYTTKAENIAVIARALMRLS